MNTSSQSICYDCLVTIDMLSKISEADLQDVSSKLMWSKFFDSYDGYGCECKQNNIVICELRKKLLE